MAVPRPSVSTLQRLWGFKAIVYDRRQQKIRQWTCGQCKERANENKCSVHTEKKSSDQDSREEQTKQLDQMTEQVKKLYLEDLTCSECQKPYPRGNFLKNARGDIINYRTPRGQFWTEVP